MKHFTQFVPAHAIFTIDTGSIEFTDLDFVEIQQALIIAMDANPSSMKDSEEGVLADFIGWCVLAKQDAMTGVFPTKPIFMYVNVNSGFTVVVLAMDAKGRFRMPVYTHNGN